MNATERDIEFMPQGDSKNGIVDHLDEAMMRFNFPAHLLETSDSNYSGMLSDLRMFESRVFAYHQFYLS